MGFEFPKTSSIIEAATETRRTLLSWVQRPLPSGPHSNGLAALLTTLGICIFWKPDGLLENPKPQTPKPQPFLALNQLLVPVPDHGPVKTEV